jgi:hypothetical protein
MPGRCATGAVPRDRTFHLPPRDRLARRTRNRSDQRRIAVPQTQTVRLNVASPIVPASRTRPPNLSVASAPPMPFVLSFCVSPVSMIVPVG